jgi:hypothetical protein
VLEILENSSSSNLSSSSGEDSEEQFEQTKILSQIDNHTLEFRKIMKEESRKLKYQE